MDLHLSDKKVAIDYIAKVNFCVTVPYRNKDIKPGTLRSILKQSGLTEGDL